MVTVMLVTVMHNVTVTSMLVPTDPRARRSGIPNVCTATIDELAVSDLRVYSQLITKDNDHCSYYYSSSDSMHCSFAR